MGTTQMSIKRGMDKKKKNCDTSTLGNTTLSLKTMKFYHLQQNDLN